MTPTVSQACWYNYNGTVLAAIVAHVSGTPESPLVELYVFARGGSGPGCGDNFRVACQWVTGTIPLNQAGPIGSMYAAGINPGHCRYRSTVYAWVEESCTCHESHVCDPASLPVLPDPAYPDGATIEVQCVENPEQQPPVDAGSCRFRSEGYSWIEEECNCTANHKCDPASLPVLPDAQYPAGTVIDWPCVNSLVPKGPSDTCRYRNSADQWVEESCNCLEDHGCDPGQLPALPDPAYPEGAIIDITCTNQ